MKQQKATKNSTSLVQVEGGKVIKQNDYLSNFVYELRDERKEKIPALDGKEAKISLVKELENEVIKVGYETIATVVDGKVEFTITETLEADTYFVEVYCGGYIFPSENTATIKVTRSSFGKVDPNAEAIREITVDFDQEIIEDDSLFVGEEVVDQEGESGLERHTWKGDELISKEIVKEPIKRIVRKGTKLHEHTAHANIAKGDNLAQSSFFDYSVNMTREISDEKQLLSSENGELHGSVAYSTLEDVEVGDHEISIKARKTSDAVTNIKFGFESLGQMQEFSDISDATTEYSFVATVAELQSAIYYHFRTNASIELESVQIRKVAISDLSWEDSGQNHVGVARSVEKELPLEFNRFEWKERE